MGQHDEKQDTLRLTRRAALSAAGATATVACLPLSVGCADGAEADASVNMDAGRDGGQSNAADDSGAPDAAADAGPDAGGDPDAAADAGADDAGADDAGPDDAGEGEDWATGGTASMVDAATYPDPFAGGPGNVCELLCASTLGPCHVASPMRQDISEGSDGLPVRLALRVVNEQCMPLPNAIVEIWHTDTRGVYSGDAHPVCNDEAEDIAATWFRGYLRTDMDGRVDFDTVFPGWYGGRAIHIHFRILVGAYNPDDDAPDVLTSQLFFDDGLVSSIFAQQPVYDEYGQPDTTNQTDGVITDAADPGDYIVDVARMTDGAMQASKTLVVSLAGPDCVL